MNPTQNLQSLMRRVLKLPLFSLLKTTAGGRFHFTHYSRAYALLDIAGEHYARSIIYFQECRKVPFDGKLGLRQIPDKLRDKLDLHSMQYLMLLKTGLEYLTHEMLPTIDNIQEIIHGTPKTNWDVVDLNLRIRALVNKLGITDPIPSSLFLLFDRRDIVEHQCLNGYITLLQQAGKITTQRGF